MKIAPITKRLSFTHLALMIVGAAWIMAWPGSARGNQEPEETTFSSAPQMDIHMYLDKDGDVQYDHPEEEVADGETFEVFLDLANPITAGKYFSDLNISFYAHDADTVIPPDPPPGTPEDDCPDQYQCHDGSHPGPPPNPAMQTWPGPTQIVFSTGKDTPITEPMTITVTMTWRDDGYFGDGFMSSDGCIRCYAGRLEEETKDQSVVKTITIKVMERCPCSIEILSDAELPKGQDSEIIVRIKNESQNLNDVTLCQYDVTAAIGQKDLGVDIPGFPATQSVGLFRGEQKTVKFTPIRPANTSALGNATLEITSVVPNNAGGGNCEEIQQLTVICEEDSTPRSAGSLTLNLTDILEIFQSLDFDVPLLAKDGENRDLTISAESVTTDCCSDTNFIEDGKKETKFEIALELKAEKEPMLDTFLGPYSGKWEIEVPLICKVEAVWGLIGSYEGTLTGEYIRKNDACVPVECVEGGASINFGVDLSVGGELSYECSDVLPFPDCTFGLIAGSGSTQVSAGIDYDCVEQDACFFIEVGPITISPPKLDLCGAVFHIPGWDTSVQLGGGRAECCLSGCDID